MQHDTLEVTFKGPSDVVMAALRDVVQGMGLTAADVIDRPEGNIMPMVRPSSRRPTTKTS